MSAKSSQTITPKRVPAFSVEKMAEAIRLAKGNITAAAEALGYSRETLSRHVSKHPELQAAKSVGEDLRLDIAETMLDRAVANGEAWAICFFLKTRGKARGYTERHEVTGADDGPVRFTIKLSD